MFGLPILGILGALGSILPSIKDLAGIFVGDKTKRDDQYSQEMSELHKEAAAEFSYNAVNRTKFDVVMDAINRLPRPLFAFGTLFLFWWCIHAPKEFAESMNALKLIPELGWYCLLSILAFFFGGRMLERARPPKAADYEAWKRAAAVPDQDDAPPRQQTPAASNQANQAVAQWRRQQAGQ